MAIALGPLLLVLVASLSSSGFDLTRKLLARHLQPVPMVLLLALGSVPLFGLAWVLQGAAAPAPGYFMPALGSVVLNLVANVAFMQSVRLAPLSSTVPMLSLTPAFTALLGLPLLGERPSLQACAGILLTVAGAFWLTSRWAAAAPAAAEARPVAPAEPEGSAVTAATEVIADGASTSADGPPQETGDARSNVVQGAWLMVAAALLWSVTIPLDKLALRHATAPFHGVFLTGGVGLFAAAVLLGQRRLRDLGEVRRAWPLYALALLSSTLALGFQLLALKVVMVSVMETLKRGLGNLTALALGRTVFGEPVSWRQLAAALLMAAGVALIVL
jgi:drug/metabolite transporter (DMT)-like permease